MYEARQNKEKVNRTIGRDAGVRQMAKIKGGKIITNTSILQRVRTIAIESALGGQHIFQDAFRASIRKSITHNNDVINIFNIDRFSWLRRNNIARNMQQITAFPNQMRQNELLLIVSHGARYLPFFAFKTPRGLAMEVFNSQILPIGYQGQIYLDGCHTGERGPFGHLGDGTSYVERFKRELLNLSNQGVPLYGNFTVKGNLGAAVTHSQANNIYNGTELIIMDARTTRLVSDNMAANPVRTAAYNPANHDFTATAPQPHYRRGWTAKVVY